MPGPSPTLSAADVVAVQLAALQTEPRDGVGPGAGIRLAWSFASPGNRAATGPLDRFADLLRNPHERHPAQRLAGEAALAAVGPGGVDEALGLVEAEGRGRDPGPVAHRADRQLELHAIEVIS